MRAALTRRVIVVAGLALIAGCSASAGTAQPERTDAPLSTARAPIASSTSAAPLPTTTTDPAPGTSGSPTAATTPATTVPPVEQFDAAAFDAVIRAATVERGDTSVGVAVVKDGVVLHESAFGVESAAASAPATASTRFRLASISKILTATVVAQLVEDGDLHLDEPVLASIAADVGAQVSDPRIAAITPRQLLSHTSGFGPASALYFDGGAATCRDAARIAMSGALTWAPGTHFRYSNTNYCLLGLAIEAATGLPYEWVVEARLLHPLGITDMRLAGTHDARPGEAVHASGANRRYLEPLFSAGAWVGTAADVARVLAALVDAGAGIGDAPVLEPGSVAAMRTPMPLPAPDPEWTYGLGLRLWTDGSWGHTGTVEQTRAIVLATPSEYVVVVLVNGEVPASDDLRSVVAYALVAATS